MTETTPRNPAALDFLLTRRSRPHRSLEAPAPSRAELEEILTAAARVPDHGQLVPFRFVVLAPAALARLSALAVTRGAALGKEAETVEKMRAQLAGAPLVVAVVASPKPSEKIPAVEQLHAAGNAALSLLNAAQAAGWGANWVTGYTAYDPVFLAEGLGLTGTETLVGWVHIGTARAVPPERPRPDPGAITTWLEA